MIISADSLANDLSYFADLGTEPPRVVQTSTAVTARLYRNGLQTTINFYNDGRVVERAEDLNRTHLNFRALLASDTFANLSRWAGSQAVLLRDSAAKNTIPVHGVIADSELSGNVEYFDAYLENVWKHEPKPRCLVCLIDGPAGIGKTSVIRSLAFRRADLYRQHQRSLILHVESRGRVLQNLADLMAFSLQTLRLTVTYDQVPILVKHGLVTLAVDGFDELGDPSGYELAWAQVNELISSVKGQGALIFSGRDTFISKSRMKSALTSMDLAVDRLEAFNLLNLEPSIARKWLLDQGWDRDLLNSEIVHPLFEDRSYALKPFFLTELARPGVQALLAHGQIQDLLSFLIEAMVQREAEKFGRDIEAVTTRQDRERFIERVMEEVARDLAENQTASIQSETLSWIAEFAASGIVPEGLIGILKHRSGVIAFLSDDERRGFKRFSHEYVYNFFLSKVTLSAIHLKEVPKYIRRNILGPDFLESFVEVCRTLSQNDVDGFFTNALQLIDDLGDMDRARRNLAALVMAACCVTVPTTPPKLKNVSMDECYLTETPSAVYLHGVVISQLDARAVDMRALQFDNECAVMSLVVDEGTLPSTMMPRPSVLILPDASYYNPDEIGYWLNRRYELYILHRPVSEVLSSFEPFNLLARIARYKPFWLKDGDEKSKRILEDDHWPLLRRLLEKHDLITIRSDVPSSGRPAPFFHIKDRESLMQLEDPKPAQAGFFLDLLEESIKMKVDQSRVET